MVFLSLAPALAEETVQAAEEAAAQADPTWAQEAVEKFAETPGTVWIAVGVLAALGVMMLVIGKSSKKWTAKTVAFGALSIALSFVLSCFRLYRMPQGGSVTPGSMLPLMLFSAAYGVGPGLLAGLAYGVLQYLQGGWFANVWQFSLDYLLAFAALGLAGLTPFFNKMYKKLSPNIWLGIDILVGFALAWECLNIFSLFSNWIRLIIALPIGIIFGIMLTKTADWGFVVASMIAVAGRALSATLAGIMFWDTAPIASLIYNGTYLIPEVIICIMLSFPIAKPVMKVLKAK